MKTGSKKGQIEKKIVLTIGSTFKKRYKMRNENLLFTCNSCQKLNHYLSAVVEIQDQEADLYFLLSAPSPNDHVCWVTGYQQTIKRAKNEMCSKVSKEPTRSLQEIYEEVRSQFTSKVLHE